ncbi:M61 family metallopeptidase [Roseiflexus castenholzii]|jgi:predicted metalloprotease with PDZ domain|uniref:Peptidase M61 domain protein n=1 Tax=Roseiflexus castenholzii (strain DSM 13941 / HLO8) TaxID=383372 RepID=A7NNU4_ROSCS|nr:PDZ domain-containing protein [Roseiflexus castenholzii]ABU59238.1 peptidase M61 domain protein [Roseiflexus castenholzii DSM 13941]
MPLVYSISMLRPHTHLYDVTLDIPSVDGPTLDLALPAWTPGSYLIRDYARHVQQFAAANDRGEPLPWQKIDKTTWRIMASNARSVRVTYQVYAFDLSVRTSHLDGTHGYFNPSNLCMYRCGHLHEPCVVHVQTPLEWRVTTGLERIDGAGERTGWATFRANDYDELVDSPFECGTHRLLTFEVDGIPHEIALWGRGNEDERQILADTRTIVETTRAMFGGLPYQRYVFIVHLVDGEYGGLEHRNSVSNIVDRWGFRPARSYERFLALTAHEFFHVWNVKRIRPAPLGPFDYARENYTRQLWVMEGITSYYDHLILLRAGLISRERYLETLADDIKLLQSQPGRALQSLEQSSFDAWIKFYRPDENGPNSSVSYYLKGSLVALLLDLEIRRRTGGARSLDDVMRYLYAEYAGDQVHDLYSGAFAKRPGFDDDDGFCRAVEAVAGEEGGAYRALLARAVASTDELEYDRAFDAVGLRLVWGHSLEKENDHLPAWHGLRLKTDHGRLKVSVVLAGGPGESAGIYAGDELIALDGVRIDEERLKARLAERKPGDTVLFSLFRRDDLLHIPLQLTESPPDTLTITPVESPTEEQQRLLDGWLNVAR